MQGFGTTTGGNRTPCDLTLSVHPQRARRR